MIDKNANSGPRECQKVAIYIRVSTSFQIDKDSLPMQRRDLIAYSELILGIPDYEVFEDAGYSGHSVERPAYQDMMKRIKAHEFTHLLVWKIDRISRNLLDFSEMYSELKQLRVVFVSKNEQFDTSTAMGEAMLKIILVFAELERNMTAERVTATMLSRASQGIWNGGKIPYGYDYDFETKQFSINEDEAAVCRLMADDYIRYRSLNHTARMLNAEGYFTRAGIEWASTSVWSVLQNPFCAGIYRYNRLHGTKNRTTNSEDEWIMFENHHEAIYSVEKYNLIQNIMKENKLIQNTSEQHNLRKYTHVFSQICYCGKCGSKMFTTSGRVHADGYRTSMHACRLKKRGGQCDNPAINDLHIGEFVINFISNILTAKKRFSSIETVKDLQDTLLSGNAFKEVISITSLDELFDLLSHYKSDDSFKMISSPRRPEKKPQVSALLKDKEKQERALQRLQDAYLYSDNSMSEKDFLLQRNTILQRIKDLEAKIHSQDLRLSDEDFVRKASYLLINSRIQDREYIYYKNLAQSVAPDILQEYIRALINRIEITEGHITGISFKNGITHRFEYKKTDGINRQP